MVLPINAALKNLPVYQPGRPIEEVARELGLPAETIIKLASNENPFGPSPLALAAMQKALAGVNLYPDGNAFYLKQKLAGKLGVEPAHLIFGNGSNEIIEFIGHALLAPGTDVIVSQYCFAVYPIVTRLFGANLIEHRQQPRQLLRIVLQISINRADHLPFRGSEPRFKRRALPTVLLHPQNAQPRILRHPLRQQFRR